MSIASSESIFEKACREIINELLKQDALDSSVVNRVKKEVSKKYHLSRMPANYEILSFANEYEYDYLRPFLLKKPVRSLSGVTVIAVMTKPFPCPHGRCAYCPGGPGSVLGDVPQSYTGYEPATMRGIQNQYDPYKQVTSRLNQLRAIGHIPSKVELIIMGGTFPATPKEYQEWFVKRCLDALNGVDSKSLEEAQSINEHAKIRNVGMTIETRPDYSKEPHVDQMLRLGATRVELGVQTVYDEIYELVDRGHTVQDVVDATRILKDSGLKVCYHMMPGLPGSNFERDLEAFRTIFTDPRFKPDMLKIYPTVVVKGTKLYEWWKNGEYTPYTDEQAADLIAEVLHIIPRWIRIQRVQRDIPAYMIDAGPTAGNMRQMAIERLKKKYNELCHEIRCREVGHRYQDLGILPDINNIKFLVEKYEASEGIELFLSYEDTKNDILIGFLRLRIPSEKAHRPEINSVPTAIVRELHVYGPQLPVGMSAKEISEWQHRGYGRKLLQNAEKIAVEEYDAKKMVIISGIGVREYYFKFGYKHDGPYVSKMLK
ncbi:MAG: tRNA uridine(34) 5-carboxymethylaminomethyl modification radical SAM/GNAT enzyme Elp3 [Candidatus Asgardarchaeia archaeon]